MKFSREIEKKLVIDTMPYEAAHSVLVSLVDDSPHEASSTDYFWAHPAVDFIRLRKNSRELTVKVTDGKDITDRIEENVVVDRGSFESAIRFNTLLFGEPCLIQDKTFSVFEAGDVTVCLYRVEGDPLCRVFLEVEAKEGHTILNVDGWVSRLRNHLIMTPEPRSLFQIFAPEV